MTGRRRDKWTAARDAEFFGHVAAGRSYAEIAQLMGIVSESAARAHACVLRRQGVEVPRRSTRFVASRDGGKKKSRAGKDSKPKAKSSLPPRRCLRCDKSFHPEGRLLFTCWYCRDWNTRNSWGTGVF